MKMPLNVARALIGAALLGLMAAAQAAIPIQRWTQPSGAQVYLVESRAVPMVDVQIDFDAGGRRDPAAQPGLANLTAMMAGKGIQAKGSDPALDENALSEAWADLGASFGGGTGGDRMSFSLRSLTRPELLGPAVRLAARELAEPSFPEDVWRRERQRIAAAIDEANTRPATVVNRTFNRAVYGDHPYGFEMTRESLDRIGVSDMRAFYELTIRPCRAVVSVVGAVTRAETDALVTQLLSRLGGGACTPLPPVADVQPLKGPSLQRIPFASAQAHVRMGQPGYRRDDPDFFPLLVGNYILGGGGFASRLSEEVRQKRGLSYSVFSYFLPGLHSGAFTVGLQTRPDQADQALAVVRNVVTRFVAEGPTAEELKAAKDNLIGGFALRIDSNRKLLENVSNIAAYNLPLDYLDTWTAQIAKVTLADVKAAMARKLQPERMATVLVGAKP